MADVGDELLVRALQLLQTGQFVEDQHGPVALAGATENSGAVDLQPALGRAGKLKLKTRNLLFCAQEIAQLRQLVQA